MSTFFNFDDILNHLETITRCFRCNQVNSDLNELPCVNKICDTCLTLILNINCDYCQEIHIRDTISPCKLAQKTYELIKIIEKIKILIQDESQNFIKNTPVMFIHEFVADLTNKIDLNSEMALLENAQNLEIINKINLTRDSYLERLNAFKSECIRNLDLKKSDLVKLIINTENSVSNWYLMLSSDLSLESLEFVLKNMKIIKKNLENKIDEIKNKIFKNQFYFFKNPSDIKFKDGFIGELKHYNYHLTRFEINLIE